MCSSLLLSACENHAYTQLFFSLIYENIVLIARALRHQFIIPDFVGFTRHVDEIFEIARSKNEGKVNRSKINGYHISEADAKSTPSNSLDLHFLGNIMQLYVL